jgi:hypothetical protein
MVKTDRAYAVPSLLWLVTACAVFFVLIFVAPGRGAGWFVDDGMFLTNASAVAQGAGWDTMLPLQPAYLFNALLFKLGVRELLHFRYVYYFLSFTSAAVFFIGLDKRHLASPVVPLAIAASLSIAFSSILPTYFFFLFGAGFYFFSVEVLRPKKELLLVLSGIFLAIAGFMHAAIFVAMILVVCIICLLDRSSRRSFFALTFVLVSLLLWGGYINWLGINNLLKTPAGHDASLSHLLNSVRIIVSYFWTITLIYMAVTIVLYKFRRLKHAMAQVAISVFVTLSYAVSYFSAQIDVFLGNNIYSGVYGAVIEAPGAVYKILFLVFLRWIGEIIYDERFLTTLSFNCRISSNSLLSIDRFKKKFYNLVVNIQLSVECRKSVVAIGGLFLVASGYAAGSASSFAICLSAFSAPALGTAFIIWSALDLQSKVSRLLTAVRVISLTIWLVIFGAFSATINLPTLDHFMANDRVTMSQEPLTGISVQPRYESAVLQLREQYDRNECQNLSFVTLDYVPMVYFILNHPLPKEFGIVRPSVYFPEDAVQRELNSNRGWCVLDVTASETQSLIRANSIDIRSKLRSRIQQESHRIFQIASPSDDIGPLQLYVRDALQISTN